MIGKWYLLTDEFDNMENHSPDCVGKIELDVQTQAQAVEEGVRIWKEKSRKPYQGYNGVTYPKNPRVVYEVVLVV